MFPRRKNTHFPFSFQPGTVESSTTPTFFYSPFSVFRWEDLPPSPPTLRAKEIPVSLIAAASLCQVEGPVRRETPFKKEVVDQVQNGLRIYGRDLTNQEILEVVEREKEPSSL